MYIEKNVMQTLAHSFFLYFFLFPKLAVTRLIPLPAVKYVADRHNRRTLEFMRL